MYIYIFIHIIGKPKLLCRFSKHWWEPMFVWKFPRHPWEPMFLWRFPKHPWEPMLLCRFYICNWKHTNWIHIIYIWFTYNFVIKNEYFLWEMETHDLLGLCLSMPSQLSFNPLWKHTGLALFLIHSWATWHSQTKPWRIQLTYHIQITSYHIPTKYILHIWYTHMFFYSHILYILCITVYIFFKRTKKFIYIIYRSYISIYNTYYFHIRYILFTKF